MPNCEEKKKRAAVEVAGALMPYAKGGGWIGVALRMFLQYQQTQTAQTQAAAGAGQAQTVTGREAELRGKARAMYKKLSWRIDECGRDATRLERELRGLRSDFNVHQHTRRGRGEVAEPFVEPVRDPDDELGVGSMSVRRRTVDAYADELRKPDDVRRAEAEVDDFFE